jgi:hypothetical protein
MSLYQGATQYGYGTDPFSIDISAPETYPFTYTTTPYLSDSAYADLELFFDGSSSPGITVVIAWDNQTTLLAPTTSDRYCLGYGTCTATSTLQFVDGATTVTATEFTVNGRGVWTGDITLDVTGSVPEPASISLVSVGFLAAGLAFAARRKRNRSPSGGSAITAKV